MVRLNNEELKDVQGGFGAWAIAGLISACVFVIGVIDGIARPIRCNQEVFMEKLNETEALDVVGGGITGTLINAFITTEWQILA